MPTAQNVFSEYLAAQKLKVTPQRMIILQVFLDNEGHVSSEELYDEVRRVDSSIGQATVYRTLKLLAESGLAKQVDFKEGVVRYEHNLGVAHHDHLICERCKRTIEIVDERIERLQEELASRSGFTLTGHRMDLFGLCPACRGRRDD